MKFEDQSHIGRGCNDPAHDEDCTCGARPDHEYERRMEEL